MSVSPQSSESLTPNDIVINILSSLVNHKRVGAIGGCSGKTIVLFVLITAWKMYKGLGLDWGHRLML